MDHTPETPENVPASEEVRQTESRAQARTRIRRAKWRLYGFWYAIGLAGTVSVGFFINSGMTPTKVTILGALLGLWIALAVITNTYKADITYQAGYSRGLTMGMVGIHHAMENGDPDTVVRITATVPHVWEDRMVGEEIDRLSDGKLTEMREADDGDEPHDHTPRHS